METLFPYTLVRGLKDRGSLDTSVLQVYDDILALLKLLHHFVGVDDTVTQTSVVPYEMLAFTDRCDFFNHELQAWSSRGTSVTKL